MVQEELPVLMHNTFITPGMLDYIHLSRTKYRELLTLFKQGKNDFIVVTRFGYLDNKGYLVSVIQL